MAALRREGVWTRAGMAGVITGLNLAEAMASLPHGLDRDLARELFTVAEAAYLPACWRAAPQQQQQGS